MAFSAASSPGNSQFQPARNAEPLPRAEPEPLRSAEPPRSASGLSIAGGSERSHAPMSHTPDGGQRTLSKAGSTLSAQLIHQREAQLRAAKEEAASCRHECAKVEQNLAVAARRRAETDRNLQTEAETLFEGAALAADDARAARLNTLAARVAAVAARVGDTEQQLATQREKDETLVAELRNVSGKMRAHVQHEVDVERAARVQHEAAFTQRMKDELAQKAGHIVLEVQNREAMAAGLAADMQRVGEWKNRAEEERLRGNLLHEVRALQAQLNGEHAARVDGEAALSGVMTDVLAQVSSGIDAGQARATAKRLKESARQRRL
jgi:hypothetical protein